MSFIYAIMLLNFQAVLTLMAVNLQYSIKESFTKLTKYKIFLIISTNFKNTKHLFCTKTLKKTFFKT